VALPQLFLHLPRLLISPGDSRRGDYEEQEKKDGFLKHGLTEFG